MLLKLTINSLYARLLTVSMTVLAISLSLMLYLSVEKLRSSAYTSFTNTISQTDLIVGSRTGSVQLLLYSVFRIGNATNNITWESYEDIINRDEIKWSVPISLGDSHKGFRVMGTNTDFFKRYKGVGPDIDPKKLKRMHLVAELREITMVPASLRRSLQTRKPKDIRLGIPSEFTLNKGHVTFFYDKLGFLIKRFIF